MKTKRVTLVSFVILISFSCIAQEGEPTYTKDVGFNTTFFLQGIFSSESTPFSLMYKKYISANKANRFGVDFFFNLNDQDSNQGSASYSEYSNASIHLNFGREIQNPINLKWTWYYGGDLIPFYEFSNRDDFQNREIYFTYKTSGFGVTLRPFLAIRYNIDPRLYISASAP